MMAQNSQQMMMDQRNLAMSGQKPGTPAKQDPQARQLLSSVGAQQGQRWFSKERLNEKMIRELLSWLGLMTGKIEGRKMLSDIGVFDSLSKLVDSNGYYDHLNQIILNSFTFEGNSYGKNLLRKWSN